MGCKIDVVVIFSCHCFTHSIHKDGRPPDQIPQAEIYKDDKERVLNAQRYELSRQFLRNLVTEMPERHIIIANGERCNFMTWHVHNANGTDSIYGVFFDTEKDTRRKRRIILRIQSAYLLDNGLTARQKHSKKVTWSVLLKRLTKAVRSGHNDLAEFSSLAREEKPTATQGGRCMRDSLLLNRVATQ